MNKNPRSSVLNRLRFAWSFLFGTLSWNSPPWITGLSSKAKNNPRLFWGTTSLIVALFVLAIYGVYCYQHRSLPDYITASIVSPEPSPLTDNDQTITPNNLIINFGINKKEFIKKSVAPLHLVGQPLSSGVEITPQIAGQWSWNTDSELLFIPTEDWQAGQKYTVHFTSNFFAAGTPIRNYDFSFLTQSFDAQITQFKFYQDPINPKIRQGVATIQFNYPVNTDALEKNTTLMFQAIKKGTLDLDGKPVKFSYTYDKHNRIAYLHSEHIEIKKLNRYLILTLNKKVSSSTNSAELEKDKSSNLLIPDRSGFLKIVAASASIIRNDKDKPEQILNVETSLGVNEKDFNQAIHVYLLPRDYPATSLEQAKPNYQWQNPGEITDKVLSLATPLNKEAMPSEQNYSDLHSFKFTAQTPRYLYIKVDKGMQGFGGFTLSNDYTAIIAVPEFPKEISFLHRGSLLALSSEKKLSVVIRGVPAVKFDFARVLPTNVNQLVTQTQGNFNNPLFINPTFNQQNISQIFSEIRQFDNSDLTKQQYTALDLSQYLNADNNPLGPQGLFLLQATGWDSTNKVPLDVKASRLILITDLGMLVKDNSDGTHDVFVESITQGIPMAKATVTVLGKNGLPILSRVTDEEGRANFPSLKDFVEDREPTVYLASINKDVSFIPFNNYNRQLNFTKFDIGGIYTNNQEQHSLSGYLFSDRGIYRPGDTMHIGMIVKQAYAQPQPPGLPLQATIVDPRGTTVKDQKITLDNTGYMELDFTTNANSPTGQYMVNLFLVKDDHPQNLLGSTSVRISEFQPDRMRITSNFLPIPSDGWTSPIGLKARVSLWNLYGAPAANRKISAKIMLTPQEIKLAPYPDYVFHDALADPKKTPKIFTETLSDLKTNDKGEAEFNLHLDKFEKTTYQLTFFAEGFEGEGGP